MSFNYAVAITPSPICKFPVLRTALLLPDPIRQLPSNTILPFISRIIPSFRYIETS